MRTYLTSVATVATVWAFAAGATPLSAQEWSLSAQAGRIRSVLDPAAASADRFAVGLRYDDLTAGLRLSLGIPTTSTDALWGGVAAWKRLAVRHRGLVAGLDLAGNAFLMDDRTATVPGPIFNPLDPPAAPVDLSGHAVAGQALPVVGYEAMRVQVHARAGLSRYAATFAGRRLDRDVRLGDVQVTLAPTSTLAVMPTVRRFAPDGEAAVTYAGVSAIAASERASLHGSVGRWSKGGGDGTPWSVGGRFWLHSMVALEVSARHDTFDPLYLQPPQSSWNVGLAWRLGRRVRSAAPVPRSYVGGRATIALPAAAARATPSIAGDFNGWKPAPMVRVGDQWTYTVAVAPGVYHYAFVGETGEWFVPGSVPGRKDDGMGGHVAVLVVR